MIELFTVREAAAELRISLSTLKRHMARGHIGYIQIGFGKKREHARLSRADLDAFEEQQRRIRERRPAPAPYSRSAPRGRQIRGAYGLSPEQVAQIHIERVRRRQGYDVE
jgi:excisionase family DNA binding protein